VCSSDLSKLFDVNYNMMIHKGNANERLASQANKILLLPISEVPKKYSKQFLELIKLIENTMLNLPSPGLLPIKIRGIYNKTAMNYIKLLYDIQDYLDHD
jgi:hypothetical protein